MMETSVELENGSPAFFFKIESGDVIRILDKSVTVERTILII